MGRGGRSRPRGRLSRRRGESGEDNKGIMEGKEGLEKEQERREEQRGENGGKEEKGGKKDFC